MSYVKRSEEGFIIAEATQQDYINQMVDAYKGAAGDIELLLAKAYAKLSDATPDQYYTRMLQYERLTKLKAEVLKTYMASAKVAGKATEKGLSAAMTESYGRQLYLIDWMIPIKAMPINESVVKYAVTGNIDFWKKIQKDIVAKYGGLNLYTPQTGTLSELLSKNAVEDLDKITQSIVNGFVNGKSYADQARDIRGVIGDYRRKKGLEQASGATAKALRIARTEGTRVMNAGAIASGKEAQAQGVKVEKEWLATLDLKTRGRHIALDGQRVGLDDNFTDNQGATGQGPGQMSAGASNYNCFTGNNTVIPIGAEKITRRLYRGDVVRIRTTSGVLIEVTPNHPILTTEGWVIAKSINKGCDIINVAFSDISNLPNHNINNKPSSFAEIFDLLSVSDSSKGVFVVGTKDFHGDVTNGYVNVESINCSLELSVKPAGNQPVKHKPLALTYKLKRFFSCLRFPYQNVMSFFHPTPSLMSFFHKSLSLWWWGVCHPNIHGFRPVAGGDVIFSQDPINDMTGDINAFSNSLDTLGAGISTDNVASVDICSFYGHVYNLQTKDGMYIVSGIGGSVNGIIAHNCRCTTMNVVNDKSPQARLAVNPVTGESEIIDFTDYKGWAEAHNIG